MLSSKGNPYFNFKLLNLYFFSFYLYLMILKFIVISLYSFIPVFKLEDCKNLEIRHLIPCLDKIYNSVNNILKIIEDNFINEELNSKNLSIFRLSKITQICLLTILKIIIRYSKIINKDLESIYYTSFEPDLTKIIKSLQPT